MHASLRIRSLFIVAWASLSLATTSALGFGATSESYRPTGSNWSITIPSGWHASPEFLQKMKDALADRRITTPEYVLALLPDDNRPIYALVQPLPALPPGSSYEDAEHALGLDARDAKAQSETVFKDLYSSLDFGKPVLDRERNRTLSKIKIENTDGTETLGYSEGALGKTAIIMIHCYTPTSLAETAFPEFRKIWDGFRFDPGQAFIPGPIPQPGISWRFIFIIAVVCAAIGALLLVGAVRRNTNAANE